MKQIFVRRGRAFAEDVPRPNVSPGGVLIRVVYSCLSPGSEAAQLEASSPRLIRRALEQPDKVRKAWAMARSEGCLSTLRHIRGKLESRETVGYSIAGIVVGVGTGVDDLRVGDRVAAAGSGYANHAAFVDVPRMLVVRCHPDQDLQAASTVTLGTISLHGIRRADLRLGDRCVVVGCGALGLLAIQLLKISGIRIIAVEPDARRRELARTAGAGTLVDPTEGDPVDAVMRCCDGVGVDAVLFCASTRSSEPLSQSFRMCRRKGRVILLGVSGMEFRREDLYEREIDFLVSTSCGPGRYDPRYEEQGIDYPLAYVRWTENRNMAEYVQLLAEGRLDVSPLLETVTPIERAEEAFAALEPSAERPILSLLHYGDAAVPDRFPSSTLSRHPCHSDDGSPAGVALIGAGQFARKTLLPILHGFPALFRLHSVINRSPGPARDVTERWGGRVCASIEEALEDASVRLVMICTRHGNHASLVLKALQAGKNVFVEKPLAVRAEEVDAIEEFYRRQAAAQPPLLLTGFNRRFSPYAQRIRAAIAGRSTPLVAHYRFNAGHLPENHWAHDDGGRIIGECCHAIDLMAFLVGAPLVRIACGVLHPRGTYYRSGDNRSIVLEYADGSLVTIEYFSCGHPGLGKERLELHTDGKSIVMDDFRSLEGYGIALALRTATAEKGHREELEALGRCLQKGGEWPIPLSSMLETSRAALAAADLT